MIGQHIYSRCLEGYFSKSGLNADSTTVTISMNMFARMEQAKLVAKECRKNKYAGRYPSCSTGNTGSISGSTQNPKIKSADYSGVPFLSPSFHRKR